METLKQQIKKLYEQLFGKYNSQTSCSRLLAVTTLANLGKDLSPTQNELGCVETIYTLFKLAFNDPKSSILGTPVMYADLKARTSFVEVLNPLAGDVILSVTGTGNGNLSNGHTGIVLEGGVIASNNSYNSKLEKNYTLKSWVDRYQKLGGMPTHYFRRIL